MKTIGSERSPIAPDTWEEPAMRSALAAREISTVYRLLRRQGVSKEQLAELTGQSPGEVAEILKGRRVMAYDVLARIADGLTVPRGYLGLAYDEVGAVRFPLSDPEAELARRRFLAHVAAVCVGAQAPSSDTVLWWPNPEAIELAGTNEAQSEEWVRFFDEIDVYEMIRRLTPSSLPNRTQHAIPALAKAIEPYIKGPRTPAFAEFFGANLRRLVRHLVPLCQGDRHRAEDVAQEAFLQAYRCWDQLREPDRAYAWLAKIATRLCWEFSLKYKAQARLSREVSEVSPSVVHGPEVTAALDIVNAVENLPSQQRLVASLALFFEMTPAEIATVVEKAPGTVRAQLHTARQKLKTVLDSVENRERPAT